MSDNIWDFCTNLFRVDEVIGPRAFGGCERLVTCELNEGLKVIGEGAFWNCTSLRNIKFPSTLIEIGSYAFRDCMRLVNAELNDGLQQIGKGAFARCYHLRNLFIPSTVTTLGSIFKNLAIESMFYNWYKRKLPPYLLPEQFPDDDDNSTHLINALKTRFDDLPIHKLCYFQAHYPTETTIFPIVSTFIRLKSEFSFSFRDSTVDVFGMTPFHILALSSKPNIDLVKLLLILYPSDILHIRDVWGQRAVDYSIGILRQAMQQALLQEGNK